MSDESIEPPAALVLGCNTLHGINVLSDWIEERTGHAPDFHGPGWSESMVPGWRGNGCGYSPEHGNRSASHGDGGGDGCEYGDSRGNGVGGGTYYGDGDGDGWGDGNGYGNTHGGGRGDGDDSGRFGNR